MSRLVSRRPARRAPRSVIPRFTPRGHDHFLGRLDNLLERGHLVLVSRCGCGFVSIAKNGRLYLARGVFDEPIGSFETLAQAVAAIDAYDEDEADQNSDDTGSAA